MSLSTTRLLAALGCLALASPAFAVSGRNPPPTARIDFAQARRLALAAQPGEIAAQELEQEKGGSGLRYSFDIKNRRGTNEVGVDAVTGQILENKVEGPNPD